MTVIVPGVLLRSRKQERPKKKKDHFPDETRLILSIYPVQFLPTKMKSQRFESFSFHKVLFPCFFYHVARGILVPGPGIERQLRQ